MMTAPGKQTANRSLGAFSVVALLALSLPVQASATGQQSCVQITNAALSSSCASGAKAAYFTFSMRATTGHAAAVDVLKTETSTSRAKSATSTTAARPGESTAPCPATGVVVTVGFAAPVTWAANPGEPDRGANTATFNAETLLEPNPTTELFSVVLDTTGVAAGTNVVTFVSYSDNEGNTPDVSGLMTLVTPAGLECDEPAALDTATATAADVSRKLHEGHEEYDCDVCTTLSVAELEALATYDNGGKQIVCDPTCLDGVSDPTHCNYFGLGQICRGCGDCSSCTPCPVTDGDTPAPSLGLTEAPASAPTPADTPSPATTAPVSDSTPAGTPSPANPAPVVDSTPAPFAGSTPAPIDSSTPAPILAGTPSPIGVSTPSPVAARTPAPILVSTPSPVVASSTPSPIAAMISTPSPIAPTSSTDDATAADDDGDDEDCSACAKLSTAQVEALAMYDNGGKTIVCDPTCLDGVSDPIHCNYFGLGQICRGCGDCSTCTPCP